MSLTVHLLLLVLALPAIAACSYLLLLTVLSAYLPLPKRSSQQLRFDVIIPAHNEAAVIENCLASLQRMYWPSDRYRLLVVADNCSDATARLAHAAGARVLIREHATLRGKGYALQLAFDYSRDGQWADAVAIVDADAEVSPNLLEAFATRIESGVDAVQAHYGVLNPGESWRTSLLAIAHGSFHSLRSRARERLRWSCGIRGNGWCLTHRVLLAVPYRAFSVTEDLEYGIALGLAGYRVAYADEAHANAVMESGEQVARRQRQRWEDGRMDLMRSQSLPLLLAAVRQRSWVCLDLALDLLVLPLSYVALNVLVLIVVAAIAALWLPALQIWLWAGLLSALALVLYVLRGWQLSGRGAAGLIDLLRAPLFIAWKLVMVLRRHDRSEWASTRRRGQ